jgi:hypothetical protein
MNFKQTRLFLFPAAMLLLAGCGEASPPPVDIDATVEARLEQALTAVPTPTAPLPIVSAAQTLAPTDAAVIAALPPTPITPPIRGVPPTSASAITTPPTDLVGINSESHRYGTGADPSIITLGPKDGGQPGGAPYPGKTSMEFEVPHATPILAPIDMMLVGFDNRNARYRTGPDGERMEPFNDLELCFESIHMDWPGMQVCAYHLLTSPLLLAHNVKTTCGEVDEWQGTVQAQGRIFFAYDDYTAPETSTTRPCQALMGRRVERGQVIGYAGSVGDHSMAPFRFKVPHETVNPTVRRGDDHLHWVQPGSFFYWKCFAPDAVFPSGVLAYPFECGRYGVDIQKRSATFKYSAGG